MSIPVIFIHKGNSDYLFNTLYQVKFSNPSTTVYLIGTKDLEIYSSLINFVDIHGLLQEANEFAKIYQHFSPNPHDYELFCIQRWFILKEFLKRNNIERALYLDSDVLFYSTIDEVAKKFETYGMTISEIAGHTNFIRFSTLTKFCDYITDCYIRSNSSILLQGFLQHFQQTYGSGVSDMTFLEEFHKMYPEEVFNYYRWNSNETMDHTLNNSEGWDKRFVMDTNYLKVIWEKNKPYFIRKDTNEKVLTHSLHFQGNSKIVMGDYVPVKRASYYWKKWFISLLGVYKKMQGQ
jgi:hypothetical protein